MKDKILNNLAKYWVDDVERCGIINGRGQIVELENKAANPKLDFLISEKDFNRYKEKMTGTWHTHPNGNANLSLADFNSFKKFPNVTHVIICRNYVVCYKMTDGQLLIEKVIEHGND